MGLPTPYWAFAWDGGQALARYILDNPDVMRGRTVLDFATGSGLAAIAAARAGATPVTAFDIEPLAIAAAQHTDRNSLVSGKIEEVRDRTSGRRLLKEKTTSINNT